MVIVCVVPVPVTACSKVGLIIPTLMTLPSIEQANKPEPVTPAPQPPPPENVTLVTALVPVTVTL